MDNSGENSDGSSDENAMVIDEHYEEKDEKQNNKSDIHNKKDLFSDNVEGDGEAVSPRQVKDNNVEENANAAELSEADADKEMEAEKEDDENEADDESDDTDDENEAESEGDDIAAGEGESDGGESESEDEESGEEGSDGDDNGGEEGSGEEEEVAEGDWETDDEVADSQPAAVGVESDSGDEVERCPICLNKFRGQDIGSPESCDHNFCLDCIMEWATNVNTCPVDRQVFRLVLAKHGDCESVYKRFPIEDKNVQESEEDGEMTYCEVCHRCDREDRLLLCDGCDNGYHCECLDPPLDSVPIEEWFCPECAPHHRPAPPQEEEVTGVSGTDGEEPALMAPPTRSSPRRRRIPRTQASERVRGRIAATRSAIAQMFESEELTPFSSSSISPRKPAKPRRKTKKRRKVTKKRKATTKKKGTKRKTKTKGKRRKTTRKKKKKASPKPSAYSPRGAAVAPAVTPKARLAGRLGLSKPPTGRTIPLQKLPLEKSMEGRRAAVGITSLSILGCRDELINFHDGDENVDPQPSTSGLVVRKASEAAARYSHSALKSHRPVQRPPLFARSNEKAPVAVPAPVSTGPVDVLGSIMQQQTVLSLMGQDVTINRDGSLTAKKEVLEKAKARSSADEQPSRSRDSPIGDGKGKTKRVSETNPKGSEMYSDDDGGRSPYTDSEDDTREPSLTAETEGSKDLKTKTPDCLPSPPSNRLPSPPATRLPSPPRDWNKSPPRSWQAGKSSPQKEGQEDFTTGGEACSSQASPVPSSQHTSPHPSSHQPSPVIDEIEPFPLCKDGYMENMDDSMSPKASGVKDSDNGQLPSGLLYDPVVDTPAQKEVDASGDNKTSPVVPVDDDLVIIPPPQEPYTRRLSVDSEDSSKEDRARLPISELPRIPKKKRRSNPIEVITIDDDDDDVEDSSRGVLQRLEHSNRKTHSSRRESKSRRDESRRSESDRHDRRSGRSNRRRNTPDNERLDSWADKRRVVLNDRGGLIVRTEDSYGDGSRSHRKHSRERSRSRDRGTDRSHERRKESRDRAYSKQESHRSRSRDRRKRRHETKDRSGSGSRSDHDRHERLDHDRYERSYHRKKKKRDRSAEGVKSDKRYVHIATEDDDFEQRSRRSRSDPRLASIEVPSKDKVDPREKARDKSSKERSDLKDAKSETWKDKHDKSVKDIKVDLRDKIDSRNKSDLRDRLDNRLQGDLREKLETKFRDKIEVKRKPESKDTRHVEEWGDHGSEKVSEDIPAGSKRSSDKVTDSVEVKRQKEDKAAVPSPDMFDDIWPSPEDQNKSNDKPQLSPGTKFKVNSSFSSVQQEKETPVKLPNTSKSDSSHPKGTDTNNVISSSVFPNEPPSHNNKPLLPTPLSFRKTNKTPPSSGDVLPQVDSMYDPSMPTETASPVTQENKEMSEQQPDISTINLQQPPPDFLLGNRLQSPTGTGLLGEGGFLIPGDPGVILQPPQNLVPISLGMLPPGFAPALPHSMPPRPGLMVNPLILNRPPPFTHMPPPGMPRFGWPGVDTQGVLQVPNQFEASSMSRFPGPFPTGPPPPIHTRPSLVNGGFEGLQSQAAAMGPRLFPPVMSVPGDPRQAIAQQGVPVSKPADTPSKSPSEQAQTTQTQPIKDSSNHLNPFNQISKLLNLRAQLVGLTKGSNANTSSSNVSGKGKVPGSGKGVFKIPLPPVTGSGEKPEKTSPTGAPSAETTEVVDMDMSPLDDDDNILVSPEYDKELKAEKEVSSVVFLNKADDLPSSAVELTNKQKAGKYMKKLHLQERVVEEVKLAIKPFYASKRIDKEEYKDILRKSVPKICHSKSGDINPAKIKSLIEAYVEKCQRAKSKVSKSNGERTKAKVAR